MKPVQQLLEYADNHSMSNKSYLENFIYDCKVRRLSSKTIDIYSERLKYLLEYFEICQITIETAAKKDLQAYILSILDKVSGETLNGRIRVYKQFYKYLAAESLIPVDIAVSIKQVAVEKRVKDTVSPEALSTLLESIPKRGFTGYRDYCIFLVFYDSMIRRHECATLQSADVDLRAGIIKVHGKGNKERLCPISPQTIKCLHFYMSKYRKDMKGETLFCTKAGAALTERHFHQIVKRRGLKVGMHLGCHLLRHSAASEYIRLGGSVSILTKILGHTTSTITQQYIHMQSLDMTNSYEKFSPLSRVHI